MTPEQRELFTERMRARGVSPSPEAQPAAVPQGGGRSQGAPATAQAGATTFDALFPPLTPTESLGQIWLQQNGKLQRVRLRLGITDGQQTELIQALDGTLEDGSEVVTSVTVGAARQAATPARGNAFPGLETGRQGFPGGGFPGGGGGGRNGGRGQ